MWFLGMAKKMTVKTASRRVRNTPAGRSDLLFLSLSLCISFLFFFFDFPTGAAGTLASSSLLHRDERGGERRSAAGADLCWLTEFGFGLKVAAGCLCAFLLLLTSELAPLSTSVSRATAGEETQEARSAV